MLRNIYNDGGLDLPSGKTLRAVWQSSNTGIVYPPQTIDRRYVWIPLSCFVKYGVLYRLFERAVKMDGIHVQAVWYTYLNAWQRNVKAAVAAYKADGWKVKEYWRACCVGVDRYDSEEEVIEEGYFLQDEEYYNLKDECPDFLNEEDWFLYNLHDYGPQ